MSSDSELRDIARAVELRARVGAREVPASIDGWVIGPRLGTGASSVVHLAEREGERVAFKRFAPQVYHPMLLERVTDEIAMLARIDHPNVARLLGHGWHDEEPYLLLELADDGDLRRGGGPDRERRGPHSLGLGALCMADTCRGLHAAHAIGIVHRDIKPDNLLRFSTGRIVVSDFGIALDEAREITLTRTADRVGTLGYLAPEQRTTTEQVSFATDIYQAGVVLAELVTGHPPTWRENSLDTLVPRVGGALGEIVGCATAERPSERFGSAEEFAEILEAFARSCEVERGSEWRRELER